MRGCSILFAFFVMVLTSEARANLILDGDFETQTTPYGSYIDYTNGSVFGSAWTVGGSDILLINSAYSEAGILFNANTGQNAVDITGQNDGGNSGANTISQNVATTPGQNYSLSFYLGNAQALSGTNSSYNLPSSIIAQATGGASMTFTNALTNPGFVDFSKEIYNFTAIGSTTQITFTNATPSGDLYAGIDTVDLELAQPVSAVPEPSSALLFGGGAIGLAWIRKRKRRGR